MTLIRPNTEPALLASSNWTVFRTTRRTLSTVQFERQLESSLLWLEKWNHQERCAVLDSLLSDSDLTQINFLWTVMQPALHRDFMYTARYEFPKQQFVPISTFAGRRVKERLLRRRTLSYHRINSAYIQWKDQLEEIVREVKLPEIPNLRTPLHRSVTWGGTDSCEDRKERQRNDFSSDDRCQVTLSVDHSPSCRSDRVTNQKTKRNADFNHRQVNPEAETLIHWYKNVWNDSQRKEFLQKILLKLDSRQHYYISGLLCVKQYKDFISYLPEKLALKILSYLTPKELIRASQVCKKWYILANNNELWHRICLNSNIPVTLISDEEPNWKKVYCDSKNTKANWNQGKCSIIHCKGHTDRVLCVTFYEDIMATGSVDKTIQIWKLDDGSCIQTLRGHLRGVWCIRFFTKHLLISGSYDCAIKMWNLRQEACVRSLLGHAGPVWAIVQKGSRLASGSQDRTARIWDANRCQLLFTLKGHHGAVYCIDMDDDAKIVITGSSDKTVRLWSVSEGEQLRVLYVADRSAVTAVSYSHGYLACSFGGKIVLYKHNPETNKAKPIMSYHEHRERIESLLLIMKPNKFQGKIVSGGQDGELKYWSVTREKSIQTYRGHNKTIKCVYCDEFRIATASYDNKVKIWDFRPT